MHRQEVSEGRGHGVEVAIVFELAHDRILVPLLLAVDPLDDAVVQEFSKQLQCLESGDFVSAEVRGEHEVVVHPCDRFATGETVVVHFEATTAPLRWHAHAEGVHDLVPLRV